MRIIEIKSWTVPMYGSRHKVPYGLAVVEHNGVQKTVRLGRTDQHGVTYLTFERRRYYYKNDGSLYNPKLTVYNPYIEVRVMLKSYREVPGREMSKALNAWDNAQSLSELTNQELYIAYTKFQDDAARLTQNTPTALELISVIDMNLIAIHEEMKTRTGISLP